MNVISYNISDFFLKKSVGKNIFKNIVDQDQCLYFVLI